MPRYFVNPSKATGRVVRPGIHAGYERPRADDDYWSDDIPRPSSFEVSDHEPTDTGLLDQHGNSIWRAPNPIGFIWED